MPVAAAYAEAVYAQQRAYNMQGQTGPMYPPDYYKHLGFGPTGPREDYGWPQHNKSLMKTIIDDIKAFIAEHRQIIYFVVILIVIDRFLLGRRLETRIKAMAEKLLGTVEAKLDRATATETPKP